MAPDVLTHFYFKIEESVQDGITDDIAAADLAQKYIINAISGNCGLKEWALFYVPKYKSNAWLEPIEDSPAEEVPIQDEQE